MALAAELRSGPEAVAGAGAAAEFPGEDDEE
jgi:hypothetical protein